jgi:hypothetical protein
LLREASSVLPKSLSCLLLAFAEVPRVPWPYIGPFEVTLEDSDQVNPVVNLIGWEFLEPSTGGVGEEKG